MGVRWRRLAYKTTHTKAFFTRTFASSLYTFTTTTTPVAAGLAGLDDGDRPRAGLYLHIHTQAAVMACRLETLILMHASVDVKVGIILWS